MQGSECVMNRTRVSSLTATLALMLILGLSAAIYAQTIKAGVSPGDSFTYSFKVFWSSTDPEDSPPSSLVELNKTEAIKITVHDVVGSFVILNVTRQYRNGTETKPSQIFVNLLTGLGDGFGLIIPPNLGPKSLVYPLGLNYSNSFLISEELVKTYPFGERTVLHSSINKTDDPAYIIVRQNLYHDKETGVLLEWIIEQIPKENPQQKISLVWEISEFNVKPQEHPSSGGAGSSSGEAGVLKTFYIILLAIAVVVAFLLALLIYSRRRISKRRKISRRVEK